ncbi:ribosome recycling factor [Candidatus Parcubacteria bacterium]|nr:ribosome recycling factor [Candidatus Parcubacteria bacterium]
MAYDFSAFKNEGKETEEWLRREYGGINTGRATPAVLDMVQAEIYGSRMPISHIASISIEDPRTLRVAPWDKTQVKDIEKAIMAANLGLSVAVDDAGLRVGFPQLTTENRERLIKVLKHKLEEGKVRLRAEREKVWNDIQAKERDGALPEDQKFKAKDELQKHVDECNKALEAIFEKKEKEVLG